MTDETTKGTYADRYGLAIGKLESDRRKGLEDPQTGEAHQYRLTDAAIARRNSEVALELLRIHSHQGRVYLSLDGAAQLAMALNAITMSEDSIAIFDGIKEGKLTISQITELINELANAAKLQRYDVEKRAEVEAEADAAAYPGLAGAGSGAPQSEPRN